MPRTTSHTRGSESRHGPRVLIRLIAVVICMKRASSGPSMTSLSKAPCYQSTIPYMVVLSKPGRVPIVGQPLVCLESENKLGGGPVSAECPRCRAQPQGVPDYTRTPESQFHMFSKESIKMRFISERRYIFTTGVTFSNSR